MKRYIVILGFVFCAFVSHGQTQFSSKDFDVIEAAFRYQFTHNTSGIQTNAQVFFIALGNDTNPPTKFLSRFKNNTPPVKPASEAGHNKKKGDRVIDAKTGQEGLLFTHLEIKWINEKKAEVTCMMAEANQSRSVKRLILEMILGKWNVTQDELLAIS